MVLNKGGMVALLVGLDFIERDYLAARGGPVCARERVYTFEGGLRRALKLSAVPLTAAAERGF